MCDKTLPNETVGYRFLDHTADVWVHAWGSTVEEAITQCVYGLMDTMIENSARIEEIVIHNIEIEEESIGSLLIAFLSEFLYLFDTEELIFHRVVIDQIEKLPSGHVKLYCVCYGDIFDSEKYIPDTEVKAITYSYLEIDEQPDRTEIKIVYDI